MASEDGQVELEDGEINDLEDGEIDEDVLLAAESLSRLEHHQQHSVRDQHSNDNSYEAKSRDFGFQESNVPPHRWVTRGGYLNSSRGRFPRDRAIPMARGRGRGKVFRGIGREKTFPAKRGNPRRRILLFIKYFGFVWKSKTKK